MPAIGILVLVMDVLCIIHALRARQPYYWFFIIIALPTIGAVLYFFMEMLPDIQHSRAARQAASDIGKVVDPDREIREATAQLRISDTAENRKRLAEALIAKERYEEAGSLYEAALTGVHADDPALLIGLARAQFGTRNYAGVCETLDRLRAAHSDIQSADLHLLYARSREGMGELDQALVEYEALAGYFPGEEARCRYALLLQRLGRLEESRTQFGQVVASVETAPKTYFRAQRDWYQVAQRNLAD